ncbi:MAG: hypothetical protein G01um101433_1018, partial [Parcubacteria group bacterium Gr01-1014_33]
STSPILIATEGIHTLQYFSTDFFGNQEATTTLILKIDKTPPEAKISFDRNLKQLKMEGTDNLSPVVVTQRGVTYTLTDSAGHTLDIAFDTLKTEGKEIKAEIRALMYDGVFAPAIPENVLQYEWSLEKDGNLKELNQRIKIERVFDVRAHYDAKKDETMLDIDMADEKKIKQISPGIIRLMLITHSGNFSVAYDQ